VVQVRIVQTHHCRWIGVVQAARRSATRGARSPFSSFVLSRGEPRVTRPRSLWLDSDVAEMKAAAPDARLGLLPDSGLGLLINHGGDSSPDGDSPYGLSSSGTSGTRGGSSTEGRARDGAEEAARVGGRQGREGRVFRGGSVVIVVAGAAAPAAFPDASGSGCGIAGGVTGGGAADATGGGCTGADTAVARNSASRCASWR